MTTTATKNEEDFYEETTKSIRRNQRIIVALFISFDCDF